MADTFGLRSDRKIDCKLRNQVTKVKRSTKKGYLQRKMNDSTIDGRKKLLNPLNGIMGRSSHQSNSCIEPIVLS